MKQAVANVGLSSQYGFLDLFLHKKYQPCSIRVPETVLLDKGFIKEWIFNSSKNSSHPILKKNKENLHPINVVKAFCLKNRYSVSHCTTIFQIRELVADLSKERKDYDLIKDKKVIDVTTVENDIFSMSLNDFLDYTAENKFTEQYFYNKWKMIQEKVTHTKIEEHYIIENVRRNHIIESKCHKVIALNTTVLHNDPTDVPTDAFKDVSPSKTMPVVETKSIEGYKFFDTFLNKQFFNLSNEIIECIEKNFKCIVESVRMKYVINKERQPFLVCMEDLYIKPARKLTELNEFRNAGSSTHMKIQDYLKALSVYVSDYCQRSQTVAQTSNDSHKQKQRCRGQFCRLPVIETTQLKDTPKNRLPSLANSGKKLTKELLTAVHKRKKRVIDKFKEHGVIEASYETEDSQSSEYESSEEEFGMSISHNVKVCENCYSYYLEVLKLFDIDSFGNIVEKKLATPAKSLPKKRVIASEKTLTGFREDTGEKAEPKTTKQIKDSTHQAEEDNKHLKADRSQPKIQLSAKRLDVVSRRLSTKIKSVTKLDPIDKTQPKKKAEVEKLNRLLALGKGSMTSDFKSKQKKPAAKKEPKPANFEQAVSSLVKKLSLMPDGSEQQFVQGARRYYRDNLPQYVQRRCYSLNPPEGIYQFMNNTPVSLPTEFKIKKLPEMSLKRLSELTDYPEIVSRSTFHFDTLICDEKTTIPFCVITTMMIHGNNKVGIPYENVIVVNDIFDSFIEYISLVKDSLEEATNKRVILFNYPGQSHTIYNTDRDLNVQFFSLIMDKLIYRLSQEHDQLRIIDLSKDLFKFCGVGYGGFLLSSYLGYFHSYFNQLSGVMLINSFSKKPEQYQELLKALSQIYSSDDPTVTLEAYLYYNKAIQSEEVHEEDLDHKAGLNPIRVAGRNYLLRSAIEEPQADSQNYFEDVVGLPVKILYGRDNVVVPKSSTLQMTLYQNNEGKHIPKRDIIEVPGGHDLMADNYDDLEKHFIAFLNA